MRSTSRLALTILGVVALVVAPGLATSDDVSDLEDKIERFLRDAESVYRFDAEARDAIWDAYCGQLDPSSTEFGPRFAAEIGQSLQQREFDQVHRLLSDVGSLAEAADRLQRAPETKDKASALLEKIRREEKKLQELDRGVVLKGSNHPFTQFAIEYGKKRHEDLCGSEGETPRICDKTWPGLDGRPDLVFVNTDGLWIYEFKPDNQKARSAGERQVRGYVDGVQRYFQQFFPKGREGGSVGTPDSDHQGESFLKKLKETPSAWSSDGSQIQARWKVVTYAMCDKRFN